MLANTLESVGVRNMMSNIDDSEDSDDDFQFDVDWVQRVISNLDKRSDNLNSTVKPKKKRKRRWKCRRKLPYSVSMFYRDFHNPSCHVESWATGTRKNFGLTTECRGRK